MNPLYSNISVHILHTRLFIYKAADKENLFNNQELLKLVIISFILMILIFYSMVILQEKLKASHS